MRTLIALFVGALLMGALTSGACCNKCSKCTTSCGCQKSCGCEKSCGCNKCKSNCCVEKKQICSRAELMDYDCPCVPICCLCVRVDFCGCESGPMTVTFKGKDGSEWGTFDVNSCEECYTFENDVMANQLDDVIFTPKDGSSATITGVKIWSKLGCGDKVTLANFDLFDAVTVGGEKGCSQFVVF